MSFLFVGFSLRLRNFYVIRKLALVSYCYSFSSPNFRGKVKVTRSGRQCQSWTSNKPHSPKFKPKNPRAQKNYCRNPDGDEKGPWCYTTDPKKRFEYCDIPKCDDVEIDKEEPFYSDGSSLSDDYEANYGDFDWADLYNAILGMGYRPSYYGYDDSMG